MNPFGIPGKIPALLVAAGMLTSLAGCSDAEVIGTVQFVESYPAGTPLDLADLEEAAIVWPRVIESTSHRFRVASFYYSRIGDGQDADAPADTPDLMAPILDKLAAAAERGVQVQLLADGKFHKTYPDVPDWIGTVDGAESRTLDAEAHWGGVLHAKYFLSDDDLLYVG
ncbi:MAG: hypothetical protein KAH56_10515, partial [Candidatus Krumholzibacteria bacterium]|nr:hypothetical protein [Candidatus Krumholzibacteria bacterium]